jgi:hypothetical protein
VIKTVRILPDSFELSFPSILEATSSSLVKERREAAKMTTAQIEGMTIEGAFWNKESLHLPLSNRKTLVFALSNGSVAWHVNMRGQPFFTSDDDAAPLQLCFPNGEGSLWEPAEVISRRINSNIVRLAASVAWVFLYTDRGPALHLTKLCGDGDIVRLFWSDL